VSQASSGGSGESTSARNERPLMRIERVSVSTLVIYVNFSLPRCRRVTVNKWLISLSCTGLECGSVRSKNLLEKNLQEANAARPHRPRRHTYRSEIAGKNAKPTPRPSANAGETSKALLKQMAGQRRVRPYPQSPISATDCTSCGPRCR
jgi:hypothetical protein